MKAAVYHAPGDIRIEDRQDPVPAMDNLVVKVDACAICGTDVKLATAGHPRCHPPRIIGHEMVGTIIHVGTAIKEFTVGERITLATTVACGNCRYCRMGLGNLCPDSKPISFDFDGAFANYLAVPPLALAGGNVIKVPAGIPDEIAALCEPLSCVANALELAGFAAGDNVLVIGGGPLGALHVALARAMDAGEVMIVQRSEPRLSMLRALAGITVIDGKTEDAAAVVAKKTRDLGADIVSVCAPAKDAQEQALRFARKGGTVSLFASLPKGKSDIVLDSRTIHYSELKIVGASDSRPEHVQQVVDLMAEGRLELGGLVTHHTSLARFHEGIEWMLEKKSLKVVVHPEG